MSKYNNIIALIVGLLATIMAAVVIFNSGVPVLDIAAALCVGVVVAIVTMWARYGLLRLLMAHSNLDAVGLRNRHGQAPILVGVSRLDNVLHGMRLSFINKGIPIETWRDRVEDIEAALNIFMIDILEGKDRRHVILEAVPATYGLSNIELWSYDLLLPDDFKIVLGRGLAGPVIWDMRVVPHGLLGGASGSGKSWLLKLILMQCIQKGAVVYIADLKGGADYARWDRRCNLVIEEDGVLATLNNICMEMDYRKGLLLEAGVSNIAEYNALCDGEVDRVVFAVDEAAELLDKTGASKEAKERMDKMAGYIQRIARIGRALGVHLVIATQRPDANVIPGQIKSNIDFRVCGRADNILSQIILDNADADDKIPKTAQGRFLTNDGVLFQAYVFDEREWPQTPKKRLPMRMKEETNNERIECSD